MTTQTGSITQRAMLVNLSISQWTARKLDKKATAEMVAHNNTTAQWARAHKTIISETELKKISEIATEARTYHYNRTLPWYDNGARILTATAYIEYTAAMRAFKNRFQYVVDQFIQQYEFLIEEARAGLNGMFNINDYPTVSKLQKLYKYDVLVEPLPNGTDFRVEIGNAECQFIQQQIEERLQERSKIAMHDVWQRVYDAIYHAQEKLSSTDAIFRNSLIENIRELVKILPSLNLTNDQNLETARLMIERDLSIYDPETLRDSSATRATAAAAAAAICDSMSAFMGGAE